MKVIFFALAALVFSGQSEAACVCQCVNGQMRPLCSSSLDLPPICPLQLCPMVPPALAPLPPMQLPPLGTSNCRNVQVWNGYQYVWRVICS
jgi:hypothetical protein